MHTCALSLFVLLLFLPFFYHFRRQSRTRPPGPKGLPFLGNILDIPDKNEWNVYAEWSRRFESDILYLNICGSSMIILNSVGSTNDLLEKRSAIYSERPPSVLFNKMLECSWNILFMSCNSLPFRELRKLFNEFFHPRAIHHFRPQIIKHSTKFLYRMLDHSEDLQEELKRLGSFLILDVGYGLQNLEYIALAEEYAESLKQAAKSHVLSLSVEWFPILTRFPSWVPFMRNIRIWKERIHALRSIPFKDVKSALAKGETSDAIVPQLLGRVMESSDGVNFEGMARDFGGTVHAGGGDTTACLLETIIYALSLHPEIQRIAQEAIDQVVGQDRLPDFSDKDSLPYIGVLIKEALRWQPIVPLGFPHCLSQDDVYEGFHLPAGSVVIGNIWAMCRDENEYQCPYQFNPERFLSPDGTINPKVRDPETIAFGFGRRVCPGKWFAIESVWITIARMIAVYHITEPVNLDGSAVTPGGEFTTGILSHPRPFKCCFKPRSTTAIELLRSVALNQ